MVYLSTKTLELSLMKLTPKEQDRLTIFTLAELARRRRARGIQLNHPEAVALIIDEVMEGVAELASTLYIEPLFDDGTKLIVLHHPIQSKGASTQRQERVMPASSPDILTINAGKPTITLTVTNTSDHPVQITSHMPFWEINARMQFDRELAKGHHLDIPAGGALRWEPGETKEVRLCPLK